MNETKESPQKYSASDKVVFFFGTNLLAVFSIAALYAIVGAIGDGLDFISPSHVMYTWMMYGFIGFTVGLPISALGSIGLIILKRPRYRLHTALSIGISAAFLLFFVVRSEWNNWQ